jgi:hypothetical protein
MIVSDEQVRHALSLWFGEQSYGRSLSRNAHSMRFMRAALESIDAGENQGPWRAQTFQRSHDEHGLFSAFEAGGHWHAVRVWTPVVGGPSQTKLLGVHTTAEAACAHCDSALGELEAASVREPHEVQP